MAMPGTATSPVLSVDKQTAGERHMSPASTAKDESNSVNEFVELTQCLVNDVNEISDVLAGVLRRIDALETTMKDRDAKAAVKISTKSCKFYGHLNQWPGFREQIKACLETHSDRFTSETAQMLWLVDLLGGRALAQVNAKRANLKSVKDVLNALDDAFGDNRRRVTDYDLQTSPVQGEQDFETYLLALELKFAIDEFEDQAKKKLLVHGLADSLEEYLKKSLSSFPDSEGLMEAWSYDEMVIVLQTLDSRKQDRDC